MSKKVKRIIIVCAALSVANIITSLMMGNYYAAAAWVTVTMYIFAPKLY